MASSATAGSSKVMVPTKYRLPAIPCACARSAPTKTKAIATAARNMAALVAAGRYFCNPKRGPPRISNCHECHFNVERNSCAVVGSVRHSKRTPDASSPRRCKRHRVLGNKNAHSATRSGHGRSRRRSRAMPSVRRIDVRLRRESQGAGSEYGEDCSDPRSGKCPSPAHCRRSKVPSKQRKGFAQRS